MTEDAATSELISFQNLWGRCECPQDFDKAVKWLLSWHRKHSPRRLSRESINKVFDMHGLAPFRGRFLDDVLDAILALQEPEQKKVWCSHIKNIHGVYYYKPGTDDVNNADAEDWGQCPVKGCGAKRPTEDA